MKLSNTKEIINYLNSKGIKSFWHFTDASNLETIEKYGIQSLKNIQNKKIEVNRFGANSLSHNLDSYLGLDTFVHLAFIPENPMYYIAIKEGRILNPVWLEIDINILYHKKCCFYKTVANKNGAKCHSFDRIKELDLNKMNHNDFNISKEAKKAEILVKDFIDVKFIERGYYGN